MKGIYIINTESSKEIGGKVYNLSTIIPSKQADGSYTNEDYAQAYANGQIIAAEIAKAYAEGYTMVKIVKGTYSLCAIYPMQTYPHYGIEISEVHNMQIDFSDSTIKVLYDSTRYNPYCLVTSEPTYKQRVYAIGLYRCTNIKLENLNLLGDALDRSWVTGEASMEQTYGITIGQLCKGITINNVNSKCFMGDSITGLATTYPYISRALKFTQWNVDKTINETTGAIQDANVGTDGLHFLVSEPVDFDAPYNAESSYYPYSGTIRDYVSKFSINGFETKLQFRSARDTYTYQKNTFGWKVALYADGKYIKTIDADIFTIIDIRDINSIRLIVSDENLDEGASGLIEKDFKIMLSQVYSHDITITNCIISDGHRGGMSNLPHNTTIKNTFVYNCGQDCGIGAPLFPDSTRYGLNNEEVYTNNLTIHQSRFIGNNISILFNSELCHIYDSQFVGGDVSANAIRAATIENCIFTGCAPSSNANVKGWRGGDKMVSNLVVKNCSISCDVFRIIDVIRRDILVDSCVIQAKSVIIERNKKISILNSLIQLVGKEEYVNNRFQDIIFHKTIIQGSAQNKGCCVNYIEGESEFRDIEVNVTLLNKNSISVCGIVTSETSKVSNYNYTQLQSTSFKDCQFGGIVEVLPDNDITEPFVEFVNSEFTQNNQPIKVMSWSSLSTKTLKVKLKNCTFSCSEDNLFSKYTNGKVPVHLKVIGCDFDAN